MSLRYDITEAINGRMKVLDKALSPESINRVAGRGAANKIQQHLFDYNDQHPNKDGFPRTNLASQFAKSVQHRADSISAEVIINHIAFRQRLEGGTITPRAAKFLTIPAIAAAYGKRAREFSNLHFGFAFNSKIGRLMPALLENRATNVTIGKQRKDGSRKITPTSTTLGGQVVFWLARRAKQEGDRNLLPTEAEIVGAALQGVDELMIRAGTPKGGTGV